MKQRKLQILMYLEHGTLKKTLNNAKQYPYNPTFDKYCTQNALHSKYPNYQSIVPQSSAFPITGKSLNGELRIMLTRMQGVLIFTTKLVLYEIRNALAKHRLQWLLQLKIERNSNESVNKTFDVVSSFAAEIASCATTFEQTKLGLLRVSPNSFYFIAGICCNLLVI